MKFSFLTFLAILMISFSTDNGKAKQPNIVFIHTDDLGYYDLSCTGSQIYQTPNVDALAAQSLSFEQSYSSYPRCTPSRYGLLTGTYPVNEDYGHLAGIPKEQSFVQVLKKAGYESSYVGKWHLGAKENSPKGLGFDHSFAAGKAGGAGSHFYPFNIENSKPDKLIEDVQEVGKEGDYLTDLLTSQTIDFIKKDHQGKPFFAMLSFYAVHTPLEAKPEDEARNKKEIKAFDFGDTPEYMAEGTGQRKMRQDVAAYAGMVENMDENVGRILQTLKDLGLDENTIVVFSSDHGGLSNRGTNKRKLATTNAPLKAGKGHLYEGGIKVPLFIKYPKKIKPAVDRDNIILGMDVFPTLIDLATCEKIDGIDGKSYVPVMKGKVKWDDRTVFWHSKKARPYSTGDSKCSVIRKGEYKLLHFFQDNRVELYNLATDPGELIDLSTKEIERTAKMLEELKAWKDEYLVPEKLHMKKRAREAAKARKG